MRNYVVTPRVTSTIRAHDELTYQLTTGREFADKKGDISRAISDLLSWRGANIAPPSTLANRFCAITLPKPANPREPCFAVAYLTHTKTRRASNIIIG